MIINKKLLPTNGVVMSKRKLPIEDYFTRLKTTSIHNIKYAESVDVLLNLLEIEAEQVQQKLAHYGGAHKVSAHEVESW